tara:strand:- start:3878 stop:4525 length:648 start_codon:yes stop_codon:yes gene_type:complete
LIQYWDQPDPPKAITERMKSWRQFHPQWHYRCLDRECAADWFATHHGANLKNAFLDIRLPAMQADVFRIAWLITEGGLWIDAATTCLSPVENWLDLNSPLLLLRKPHQEHPKVCSGLIYTASPSHPLLVAAWQSIQTSLLARTGTKVYRSFGPGLLRDLLASGRWDDTLTIRPVTELKAHLQFGSSSKVLPAEQHWSRRQQSESLYFSECPPVSD